MRIFFIVLARDAVSVSNKALELEKMGYPYVIVCGERVDRPNVVFRQPVGKFDAMNFGLNFVPDDVDVIAFNDVDTEVHNFDSAIRLLREGDFSLVFVRVGVRAGPQLLFYGLLDALRRWVPIAASGELMLLKRDFVRNILPLRECKSEDSYLLFKVLEQGGKIAFCEDCYVETVRTAEAKQEEGYKRRTTGGIYQALSMAKPPFLVRLFYTLLPYVSVLLLLTGKSGYYWSRGIILGYVDYIRGDTTGVWKPNYRVDVD